MCTISTRGVTLIVMGTPNDGRLSKIVLFGIGILSLTAPAFAAADFAIPLQATPAQFLARDAFLKSQISGVSVACIVMTNKTTVAVHEAFALWWSSYGAIGDGWAPAGAYTIVVGERGVHEYAFTFRGESSASATCSTVVSVS